MLPAISLLGANVGRSATQALLLVAFALEGGAEGAAGFALALAVLSPIFMFLDFGLRNAYQTVECRPPLGTFLVFRLASAAAATIISLMVYVSWQGWPFLGLAGAIAIQKVFDSIVDVFVGHYLSDGEVGNIAALLWLKAASTAGLIGLTIVLGGSANLAVWLSAGASAFLSLHLTWDTRPASCRGLHVRLLDLRTLLAAGTPLGITQGLISVTAYVPVMYLNAFGTTALVGVYAACQHAVTLANLAINTVQQVALRPLRASWRAGSLAAFLGTVRAVAAAALIPSVAMALALLFGLPWILPRIYGSDFTITVVDIAPLSFAIVALGADYVGESVLMTANRYTFRLSLALVSLVAAATAAAVLGAPGTLTTASLILAIAYVVRAAATWTWFRRRMVPVKVK